MFKDTSVENRAMAAIRPKWRPIRLVRADIKGDGDEKTDRRVWNTSSEHFVETLQRALLVRT